MHINFDNMIFITQIDCINLPPGAWYSLTLYPEYLRLFDYYGDELTTDSNYEDWSGGSFLYPPGISYGSNTYYNDLYCDWSLCMDFDQDAISNSGEVYIRYKLIQYKFWGQTEYITKYYDSFSYDTQYTTNLYFGMGTIVVYIEFQLLEG
ncbi:MAG: hypothetical protein ACTSP5_03890 [Candidatus Heimdallarchaeota archaeon]